MWEKLENLLIKESRFEMETFLRFKKIFPPKSESTKQTAGNRLFCLNSLGFI